MNKQTALNTYAPAERLRYDSTPADWLAVFPTRAALLQFRADVGALCWPGSFGSSPWEFAYGVAYHVACGFSESSAEFYAKECARGCRYALGEMTAVNFYGRLEA